VSFHEIKEILSALLKAINSIYFLKSNWKWNVFVWIEGKIEIYGSWELDLDRMLDTILQ
jgi:hypothetical protein